MTRKEGPTSAQTEFVRQFFLPLAEKPGDETKVKERWVQRKNILAGYMRWVSREVNNRKLPRKELERMRSVTEYLSFNYDKYVHGGYMTSMELFDGQSNTFMLRGHKYEPARQVCKFAVASKLHNFMPEFAGMAEIAQNRVLVAEISSAALELYDSGELS